MLTFVMVVGLFVVAAVCIAAALATMRRALAFWSRPFARHTHTTGLV